MQLVNLISLVVAAAVASTRVKAFPLIPTPSQIPTSPALLNKSVGDPSNYAVRRLENANESAAYSQDGQHQGLSSLWGHFSQRGLPPHPANETMPYSQDGQQQGLSSLWGHFTQRGLPPHPANETMEHFAPGHIVQRGMCGQGGVEDLCNPNFGRDVFQGGLMYEEEDSNNYAVSLENANESAAYSQDGQHQGLSSLWGHFSQRELPPYPANETMELFAPGHIVQRGMCGQGGVEDLCNPIFERDIFQGGLVYEVEDSKNVGDGLSDWNHTTERIFQEKEVAQYVPRDRHSSKRELQESVEDYSSGYVSQHRLQVRQNVANLSWSHAILGTV